jgi:ankyrin repeat protein
MSDEDVLAVFRAAFGHARRGDTATLRALLDAGVAPGVRNERGDSLLMLASYHGHAETVRLLLERGADPDVGNDRGQTPLAGAAFKGWADVAALLVDGGAGVDNPAPDGKTPLMFAAMFDQVDVVDLLLARGADADRADGAGNTARSLADAMGARRAAGRLDRARSEQRDEDRLCQREPFLTVSASTASKPALARR